MGYPVIQTYASGSVTGNATTWTMTYPSGIQANDLIIAMLATDGGATASADITWQKNAETYCSSNGAVTFHYFYKFVSSGTLSGTFNVTMGASEQGSWAVFRISGADPAVYNPEATTQNSASVGASANPNPPSLTSGRGSNDFLWLAVTAVDTSRTVSGFPANYLDTHSLPSGGSGGATLAWGSRSATGATEDPGAFTISASDDWVAYTIAIKGAASTPPQTLTLTGGIASAQSLGSPTVSVTGPNQTISAAGAIGSGGSFGSPTVGEAAAAIRYGQVSSVRISASKRKLKVDVPPISSSESLGTPALQQTIPSQTLGVTAITSAGSFGDPQVQPGARVVSPSSITGAASLGTPQVTSLVVIAPIAIPSAEQVTTGSWLHLWVTPPSIVLAGSVPAPSLIPGTRTVLPESVGSGQALEVPALQIGDRTLQVIGIFGSEALPAPQVSPGPIQLSVGSIPTGSGYGFPHLALDQIVYTLAASSSEAFGSPVVEMDAVILRPLPIASAEAWGTPSIQLQVAPVPVSTAEQWGTADLQPGPVTLQPPAVSSGASLGAPTLVPGSVQIQPLGLPSLSAMPEIGVYVGPVALIPAPIPSSAGYGSPQLSVGAIALQIPPIGSAEQVAQPTLRYSSANLLVQAIGSAEQVAEPRLLCGSSYLYPVPVASQTNLPTTAIIGWSLMPSPIPSMAYWGSPAVVPGLRSLQVPSVPSLGAVGDPRLHLQLSVPGIASSETVGQPSLMASDHLISVSPIVGLGMRLGTPSMIPGEAVLHPQPISAQEHLGLSRLSPGSVSIQPSAIGSGESVGLSSVRTSETLLQCQGIRSAESWQAPWLVCGGVALSPLAISSTESWGALQVRAPIPSIVQPDSISSAEFHGRAELKLLYQIQVVNAIPSAAWSSTPTILQGAVTLRPISLPSQERLQTLIVRPGSVTLSPDPIGTISAWGTPELIRVVTLFPQPLSSLEAWGRALVQGSDVFVAPDAISSLEQFGNSRLYLYLPTVDWSVTGEVTRAIFFAGEVTRIYALTDELTRQISNQESIERRIEASGAVERLLSFSTELTGETV